jgi:serine/threonine-protein kinase
MGQLERSVIVAGKYELLEEIGRGGMGSVWRAYAPALGRGCALKTLLPGSHPADERQRARLFREARIAAKLRSPYIVTVYDVGDWEGTAFIAMELLEGMTLRELLGKSPVLQLDVTLEIMRQLALGLDKAHQASLIHRDLKPDNIFILDHQPLLAKILDFGIAKDLGPLHTAEFHTTTGAISGTPLYMSPEQACGKQVDFRSDLWSLAVIAYECIVGKPPFSGETLFQLMLQIVSEPLPVPSQVRPSLPPTMDRWWARAASRAPADRPGSALQLVEGLRAALEQAPNARDEPEVQPSRALVTRRRVVAAAAAGVLAAATYAWSRRSSLPPSPPTAVDAPAHLASHRADALPAERQTRAIAAAATPERADAVPAGRDARAIAAAATPERADAMSAPPSKRAEPEVPHALPKTAEAPALRHATAPAARRTSPTKLSKDAPPKHVERPDVPQDDPLGF